MINDTRTVHELESLPLFNLQGFLSSGCFELKIAISSPEEPQGPVFLTSFPRDVTHVNTEDVRVPCVAFARPAPAVEWITDRGTPVQDVPGERNLKHL